MKQADAWGLSLVHWASLRYPPKEPLFDPIVTYAAGICRCSDAARHTVSRTATRKQISILIPGECCEFVKRNSLERITLIFRHILLMLNVPKVDSFALREYPTKLTRSPSPTQKRVQLMRSKQQIPFKFTEGSSEKNSLILRSKTFINKRNCIDQKSVGLPSTRCPSIEHFEGI
jgi:hypothetical protein